MTADEVRQKFLDYFKKYNHTIIKSSSVVPSDDPTLLFTNAGMVQFKRYFIGEEQRDYKKAVSSQKCIRAGGKHNDLENVGYTARHHTFFEMLGNFSFGDYFKENAIEFAWDLLTNGFKLPSEKLWVSVYEDDDEAFKIWEKKIGVRPEKIVRLGALDNFWAMGDTGPCGPCSEILIDRGDSFGCGKPECQVGCDCDRFLEIWNLVFMQFNRTASGQMENLPKPSIDTGMGLERILSVIHNTQTNYDTDLFSPIIKKIEELSEKKYKESFTSKVAMRVIADHTRAAAFIIGDGILPANEGRGYVLRRILRRALRYGRSIGLNKPFLTETVKVLFDIMQNPYPELKESAAFIENIIKNEEARFSETLDNGLRLLTETLSSLSSKGKAVIPGDIVFKLYDTYGFPIDIVKDIIRGSELSIDMDGFNSEMEKQKQRSKSISSFGTIDEAYKNLSSKGIKSEFVGYGKLQATSKILLMVKDGKEIDSANQGEEIEIVTEQTPFYAESGGQTGDSGKIIGQNFELEVLDTIKDPTGIIIHKCKVLSGIAVKQENIELQVDDVKRQQTALNHTATHILHYALRTILGDHVKQAGSLVSNDKLRFDFTHFSQVEIDDLMKIERLVNEKIWENNNLVIKEMAFDKAVKTGAIALFEEKYGDKVRVISIGDFSSELCGGTHIDNTGKIGLFKIFGESSAASGIRRIEASTGTPALLYTQMLSKTLSKASSLVKEKIELIPQRLEKILSTNKSLEKEVEELKGKIGELKSQLSEDDVKLINGIKVVSKHVIIDKPQALRNIADKFKDKIKSGIVVLGSTSGAKGMLIVMVSKDLIDKYDAGKIVNTLAKEIGGSGGGRKDMAQAGGPNPENLNKALEKVHEVIANF
ncbi:MAG: alanine--tRNA ligase [Desulfobacterales bacterium]|nr:alanine--tRNA ligase [Desulfobacterales bacterium]